MKQIKQVYIIYNPVSTGNSRTEAKALQKKLTRVDIPVKLLKTDYAGHAAEIAKQYAKDPSVYLVSSSGDGTYHEIVNAILQNSSPESRAVTGLLPSGNANDHYHFVHQGDVIERLTKGDIRAIDTLKITYNDEVHYAHSYAGLGITSQIGAELNKHDLHLFKEAKLVLAHLLQIHGVSVRINGRKQRFDSLVFSTNGRMSKVLTLSTEAKIDDGLFEVNALHSTSSLRLFAFLFKASTVGIDTAPQQSELSFTTLHKTSMQLDGEIVSLRPHTKVTVTAHPRSLFCII